VNNGTYSRADSDCSNYAGTPPANQCPSD
jgi:hypothetical protein